MFIHSQSAHPAVALCDDLLYLGPLQIVITEFARRTKLAPHLLIGFPDEFGTNPTKHK